MRMLIPGALLLMACAFLAPGGGTPTPLPPPTRASVITPAPTRPKPTPAANSTTIPVIVTEGGPYQITGHMRYSNDIITTYYVEQAVALVDMYGFVIRDEEWEIPYTSQTLGFLELDAGAMEGDYWLQLPARPSGTYVDVDNDGAADAGVQIFAVAYWPNLLGSPFSVGDDKSHGWPSGFASVITDPENSDEVTGGRLVVWAPDDQQHFPVGFGSDGLLFTADDPVGPLPPGYSIVDLDQNPFGLSQEVAPQIELFEPSDLAVKDYSDLSYTEAFDRLYEKVSKEWAFNGVPGKEVDWEALYAEIRPRVQEAERDDDGLAFYRALHAFIQRIPDGHVNFTEAGDFFQQDFFERAGGGYGMVLRELDDGAVIVTYLVDGGAAEQAGIEVGAEITEVDGEPVGEAISRIEPVFGGPFSLESTRRTFQVMFLTRNPTGTRLQFTVANPGEAAKTVLMTSEPEVDSLLYALGETSEDDPTDLPVEAGVLDSGIGYIKITTNYDDLGLIIRLFERALQDMTENDVNRLIIDLRNNGGGAPLGLAGFLYDQDIVMGQLEYYSEATGRFEPEGQPEKVTPYENQYPFDGLAVLVGQNCASACEIEAYAFSQIPGAIIVGMYPSAGVEAEVSRGQFKLPEGIEMQFSTGRFVLPDGSIFLEGAGVQPTLRVPITRGTALTDEDAELIAAQEALGG
jgi:C-terminal processing protease CtpA/Prc